MSLLGIAFAIVCVARGSIGMAGTSSLLLIVLGCGILLRLLYPVP